MTYTLYRFFDDADRLLYVGKTIDPGSRMKSHKREKDWWEDVAYISMDHSYPTHDALLEAEAVAIKRECPLHNVIHNRDTAGSESAYDADALDARADWLEAEAKECRGRAEATRLIETISYLANEIDAARGNPAGTYEHGLYWIYNDVDCHEAQYVPLLNEFLEYAKVDYRYRHFKLGHEDCLRLHEKAQAQ